MLNARIQAQNPEANLKSYDQVYNTFTWSDSLKSFTSQDEKRVNIVKEAIDRWADHPQKQDKPALIFEKNGSIRTYSFLDLKAISCRWANALINHGFRYGDRLFIFLPPCPEIYFTLLACARIGVVFCPLFASLGFDELEERINDAKPRAIITCPDMVENIPGDAIQSLTYLYFTNGPLPGIFHHEVLIREVARPFSTEFDTPLFDSKTPLYLLYTSGSTGPPKGVVHGHCDMVGHLITARYCLDLDEGSVLWTDCDPAWVTGTVYGAFAPWLCCAASLVLADPFSVSTCYRTLEFHKVSVWYNTPGTIAKLKESGEDLVHRYDFSSLKHVATVGEALIPELIYWFRQHFKITPHDTWWMTETGMICLSNFPSMDVKPGSMGKPVPGIEAAIIDENGNPLPPMTMGELAIKVPWPAMMTAIWQDEKRYRKYFRHKGWFLTGDVAIMNDEGYFYHQGRMDDMIKVDVKLVGPYEIERALRRHPSVSEAAVISRTIRPKKVFLKAFVTLHEGVTPCMRLKREIKSFVKADLSPEIDLKEITILDRMPKTRSGKLMRRSLRAMELGVSGI